MQPRSRGAILLLLSVIVATVLGTAGCGSSGESNVCKHRCPLKGHNYYLDGKARNARDIDHTTQIIRDAGYTATVQITGSHNGDWWTFVYTKCSAREKAKACYKASRTMARPLISRLTKPGKLDQLGYVAAQDYKDNVVTVDMGSVVCNSVTTITADRLRQLPQQVAGLRPRQEAYRLPSTGPVMFTCNVTS
jgi:hypothetical protein